MNFSTNKAKATAVIFVLVLTFSAILAAFPIVSAHDPPLNIPTWSYVSVSLNPVGVGQTVYVVSWMANVLPTTVGSCGDLYQGLEVEVTKPDGSKETLGPFTADPVGTIYCLYTPDQVGTYTFQMSYPGQTLTGEPVPPLGARGTEYIGDYFEPCTSDPVSLIVQEEPIEA
jgi:hypothetical protein